MHNLEKLSKKYKLVCTLTYGDIYGQIVIWLGVIFASLAVTLSMMSSQPILAVAALGLILVVSLPFLLFAFVTTLFNHIEVMETVLPDEMSYRATVFTRTSEPD